MKTKKTFSYFPFFELQETNLYPHSRTYRSSFFQKLKDSFYVFSGSISQREHPGLFDYLTLFIPYLALKLIGVCITKMNSSPIKAFCLALLFIINLPLVILRYASSAVAALLFSPITGAVSLFSYLASKKDRQTALTLVGEINIEGQRRPDQKSFKHYLKKYELDIEDLGVAPIEKDHDSYNIIFKKFHTTTVEITSGSKATENIPSFKIRLNKDSLKSDHPLFKLNLGQIVSTIENSEDDNLLSLLTAH